MPRGKGQIKTPRNTYLALYLDWHFDECVEDGFEEVSYGYPIFGYEGVKGIEKGGVGIGVLVRVGEAVMCE